LSACFFMIRRGCFCFVLPSTRRSKNEHMQHLDVFSGPSESRARKS
jgi:hypothetical protein